MFQSVHIYAQNGDLDSMRDLFKGKSPQKVSALVNKQEQLTKAL